MAYFLVVPRISSSRALSHLARWHGIGSNPCHQIDNLTSAGTGQRGTGLSASMIRKRVQRSSTRYSVCDTVFGIWPSRSTSSIASPRTGSVIPLVLQIMSSLQGVWCPSNRVTLVSSVLWRLTSQHTMDGCVLKSVVSSSVVSRKCRRAPLGVRGYVYAFTAKDLALHFAFAGLPRPTLQHPVSPSCRSDGFTPLPEVPLHGSRTGFRWAIASFLMVTAIQG